MFAVSDYCRCFVKKKSCDLYNSIDSCRLNKVIISMNRIPLLLTLFIVCL